MRTTREAQVTARDTQRLWLIRQNRSPARIWCETCGERVQVLTMEEAAALRRTDAETVASLVKLGEIHSNADAEQDVFICLNSLL